MNDAYPDPDRRTGWWTAVWRVAGAGPRSDQDAARRVLIDRVKQPMRGPASIAVLSQKGGVGKTTVTVGMGATLTAMRGDRIVAVDANPDFGTLAQRGPDDARSTVRDVLSDHDIVRYSDMRKHTSRNSSQLEILASERDPAISEAFSDADYQDVLRVLRRFYSIILTDCGTGLVHSAMPGVLREADAVIVVASPAVDSARSAWATFRWLERHGYSRLVPGAILVVSASRPGAPGLDMEELASQFVPRIRAMHTIPFDDHLAEGTEIDLARLRGATRQSFLELAATVTDGFTVVGSRDAKR